MKLVIDEKVKHRLIGIAVIISLGAIFAPAMMKKSNQNNENTYSVRVQLPAKPTEPHVAITDEREVFKTIKIAKVDIPTVSSESQLPELAKAESLHEEVIASHETPAPIEKPQLNAGLESVQIALNQTAKSTLKHLPEPVVTKQSIVVAKVSPKPLKKAPVIAAKVKPQPHTIKVAAHSPARKPAIRADVYAVQLASFSRLANAQALVNKLHSKGYKASFTKIATRQGVVYKVYAGHSPRKMEVVKLKTQLASAMQLNGFIVNTGVS